MKLSSSLLSAITLGVSITVVAASTTSCEKEKIKQKLEQGRDDNGQNNPNDCPACGMG